MLLKFAACAAELCRDVRGRFRFSRSVLRKTNGLLSVLALAGAMCSVAMAQQTRFNIDPSKSQVQFSLGGFHEVNGFFKVSKGDIRFDRKTSAMSGLISVEAGSGNSGNGARDKKMKSDELHASKFPSVTFAPSQFTGILKDAGESSIQVHGTFTLIGKPHPIVVPMTVTINGSRCVAKGSFVVPYVQWGMKDPTMMFMKEAKDVKVDLTLVGSLTP
jgi:polyisoprenoid-binding protein YceI